MASIDNPSNVPVGPATVTLTGTGTVRNNPRETDVTYVFPAAGNVPSHTVEEFTTHDTVYMRLDQGGWIDAPRPANLVTLADMLLAYQTVPDANVTVIGAERVNGVPTWHVQSIELPIASVGAGHVLAAPHPAAAGQVTSDYWFRQDNYYPARFRIQQTPVNAPAMGGGQVVPLDMSIAYDSDYDTWVEQHLKSHHAPPPAPASSACPGSVRVATEWWGLQVYLNDCLITLLNQGGTDLAAGLGIVAAACAPVLVCAIIAGVLAGVIALDVNWLSQDNDACHKGGAYLDVAFLFGQNFVEKVC